jgi:hypothetical protein
MPLFNLTCQCGNSKRVLANNYESITQTQKTCKCGLEMSWLCRGPHTSVIEKLDNGSMVVALERYSEAERIFNERYQNADPLAGTKPNRS